MTLNFPDLSELRFSLSPDYPQLGLMFAAPSAPAASRAAWGCEAGRTQISAEPGQSHGPAGDARCHLGTETIWFAGQKCTERGFLPRHRCAAALQGQSQQVCVTLEE